MVPGRASKTRLLSKGCQMLIFHFNALPVNQHFAAGLEDHDRRSGETKPRPKPVPSPRPTPTPRRDVSALDRAWRLGFEASQAEGPDVAPPASFTPAEAEAFRHGADSAFMGAWDAVDDLIDRLEAEHHDRMMCGL